MDDSGGGASRSTDPAAGTSAATDVSLREFIEQRFQGLERVLNERRVTDQTAVRVAKETADAALLAHNDLIKRGERAAAESQRQLDKLTATYATLEMIQALEKRLDKTLSLMERGLDSRLQNIESALDIGSATKAERRGTIGDVRNVLLFGFTFIAFLIGVATYLAQN